MGDTYAMPPNEGPPARGTYRALLFELRRGLVFCSEASDLRLALVPVAQAISRKTPEEIALAASIDSAIEACSNVSRLRIELYVLEQRLRELDPHITPLRPSSGDDVQDAYAASELYSSKRPKPFDSE